MEKRRNERLCPPLKDDWLGSGLNLCAENGEKFGEPTVESRPGGTGDQIAVDERIGHGQIDVGPASDRDVGPGGRIGAALFPLQDASGGENLRGVADRGERFV